VSILRHAHWAPSERYLETLHAGSLEPLSAYAIDMRTGFVPAVAPLNSLPAGFADWESLVPNLSALIRSGRFRAVLAALPSLDPSQLRSNGELERALLLLTVFANAHVWGGEAPDLTIPASVAVPLCTVAQALDRPPIVHYASMALNNWCLLDPHRAVSADNARMQVQFLGGVDEDWFFMASLGVELAGAPLLPLVHAATLAAQREEDEALASYLEQIAAAMEPVQQALDRMREWCDPRVFYHRVRRFLTGWPDPGVKYAGVSDQPRKYVGGSAAQSSLIQALDALLAVAHVGTVAGPYLRDVRRYMPVGHRRFIEDIERHSRVRARGQSGSPALRSAYNAAVEQVDVFRRLHIGLAHDYVAKPSGMAPEEKGTGNTNFVRFLRDTRTATTRSRL
jgi:indoleamine 2,3-dioxygenase